MPTLDPSALSLSSLSRSLSPSLPPLHPRSITRTYPPCVTGREVFREAYRVLRPGGAISFMVCRLGRHCSQVNTFVREFPLFFISSPSGALTRVWVDVVFMIQLPTPKTQNTPQDRYNALFLELDPQRMVYSISSLAPRKHTTALGLPWRPNTGYEPVGAGLPTHGCESFCVCRVQGEKRSSCFPLDAA